MGKHLSAWRSVFTRRAVVLAFACTISGMTVFAQDELCVGNHFTPEEGAAILRDNRPVDKKAWESRRQAVIAQIKAGMGLEKLPPKPSSQPIRHGKKTFEGYTVENVAFESLPGIYITGNLYEPTGRKKGRPAILAPHGHGRNPDGRFMEQTQIRAAMLARAGAVVFTYDMIGHGDSQHSDHKIPKALKLQTINSVRALDFLLAQPGIDLSKVAVTGESGGGTQTFLLAALDDRVKVTAPVVMVSGFFFGGCVCESGMPIHKKGAYQTTNAEIAALTAPRPMLLVSDGKDWTRFTPESEFPYMQHIYQLYGKKEAVANVHLPEEGHDFGPSKRKALYDFMGKYLGINLAMLKGNDGQFDESRVKVLAENELRVFDDAHPRPANYVSGDVQVNALLDKI